MSKWKKGHETSPGMEQGLLPDTTAKKRRFRIKGAVRTAVPIMGALILTLALVFSFAPSPAIATTWNNIQVGNDTYDVEINYNARNLGFFGFGSNKFMNSSGQPTGPWGAVVNRDYTQKIEDRQYSGMAWWTDNQHFYKGGKENGTEVEVMAIKLELLEPVTVVGGGTATTWSGTSEWTSSKCITHGGMSKYLGWYVGNGLNRTIEKKSGTYWSRLYCKVSYMLEDGTVIDCYFDTQGVPQPSNGWDTESGMFVFICGAMQLRNATYRSAENGLYIYKTSTVEDDGNIDEVYFDYQVECADAENKYFQYMVYNSKGVPITGMVTTDNGTIKGVPLGGYALVEGLDANVDYTITEASNAEGYKLSKVTSDMKNKGDVESVDSDGDGIKEEVHVRIWSN